MQNCSQTKACFIDWVNEIDFGQVYPEFNHITIAARFFSGNDLVPQLVLPITYSVISINKVIPSLLIPCDIASLLMFSQKERETNKMADKKDKITWSSFQPKLSQTTLAALCVNKFIFPTPVQVTFGCFITLKFWVVFAASHVSS